VLAPAVFSSFSTCAASILWVRVNSVMTCFDGQFMFGERQTIGSYVVGASVKIDCSVTDECCLGHPEEDHDERKTKCTSHGIEGYSVAACFDENTS